MHPIRPLPASEKTVLPRRGTGRWTVVLPGDLDARLDVFPRTPADGQLLVLETRAKLAALPFHRQKLTLVVSALRHFVAEQRDRGFHVELRVADDYAAGLVEFSDWAKPQALHAMEPREFALDARLRALTSKLPLTLHPDGGEGGHFLLSRREFTDWADAQGPGPLRMDRFYPVLRKRFGLLLDGKGKPLGGSWSQDALNRLHARGVELPALPQFPPDALTRAVMKWVARPGVGRWGSLEGFNWPVTRTEALRALDDFIQRRLESFGPYEDAIRSDGRFLFHSLLSSSLNLGLLHPREVVDRVAAAHEAGQVSLASAEGMVRQVLGWREFIRGIYWRLMPGLRTANQLGATRPLPDFFWEPKKASMRCLEDALGSVEATGYTHHINRLMVLCNYATLAGLDPRAVSHWFWAAFVDAYEWVELPNVVGMGMFGTDAFTTKPYVASAQYLKRQSGLGGKAKGAKAQAAAAEAPCVTCRFDPDVRVGPQACPFNALYWDFLARHRARLESNPRMATLYRSWDRWKRPEQQAIQAAAEAHRAGLSSTLKYDVDENAG